MNTRPRHFLPGIAGASQPMKSLTPTPLNAQPGNGPIAGLTDFFSLNLVNFDWVTWHDYEWENWVAVDALLNAAIGFLSIRGIWRPNTAYTAGDTVFDPADTTLLYTAHTNHTSSTDFNTDKPLYWDLKQAATPPVQSVFGRIGAVVATAGDYDAFYYTQAQVDASQAAQDALILQNATDITSINTNLGANYYTKAEVDAAQAVQDSAIAQNASDIAQNVSDIAANAAAIAAVSGDLSANYYTKTEQDATDAAQDANITQNASDITANANAISALATDLANNYYTIAQQDVTDAAQDTAITDNANAITALNTSLGNYYTKTESDAKFFNYAGAWAAGTYDPSQVVTHNDGTWLCLVQTTDEPTSLSADWLALGSAGAKSTVGDTFPTVPAPQNGDMHFSTSPVVGLYIYYDDGNSKQWVQTNGGSGAGTLTEIVEANTTEGWQVWGDVLIQWGAIAATDPPAGLGVITYPQPFKAGSLPRVSATTIEDTGGYGVNVTTISATNTDCPVRCYDLAGNRINANVQWVAVGEAPDALKKPKTVSSGGGSAEYRAVKFTLAANANYTGAQNVFAAVQFDTNEFFGTPFGQVGSPAYTLSLTEGGLYRVSYSVLAVLQVQDVGSINGRAKVSGTPSLNAGINETQQTVSTPNVTSQHGSSLVSISASTVRRFQASEVLYLEGFFAQSTGTLTANPYWLADHCHFTIERLGD